MEEIRRPEDQNIGRFHARIRRVRTEEVAGMIGGKLGIAEILILNFIMMGFFDFLVGFGMMVWTAAKTMSR